MQKRWLNVFEDLSNFVFVLKIEQVIQGRNQERANWAIAPPRNFCKHDAIHVLHMKSYFLRLRCLYVNFFSRQLYRIRAASYWIKLLTSQCTMLPKTPNTEPETSCEELVVM